MANEHEPHLAAFGDRLRKLRKKKGLIGQQVADKLGISKQQYSHYERGRHAPTVANLPLLASALGVSVRVLVKPLDA